MSPAVRRRLGEAAGRAPLLRPAGELGPRPPSPTPQTLAWRAAAPPGRAGLTPPRAQGNALAEWVLQAMTPAELVRLLRLAVLPTATGADERLGRVVADELVRRLGEVCRHERGQLGPAEASAAQAADHLTDLNGLLAQAQRAVLEAPFALGAAEDARRRAATSARRALHMLHDNEPGRPRRLATLLSVVRCLAHLPSAAHAGLPSAALEALQLLLQHPRLSPFRLAGEPTQDAAWLREQLQPVVVEVAVLLGEPAALRALERAADERGPWLAHWLAHDGAADWASVALARGQAPLLTLLHRLSASAAVGHAAHVYLHQVELAVHRAQAANALASSAEADVMAVCTTCLAGLQEAPESAAKTLAAWLLQRLERT